MHTPVIKCTNPLINVIPWPARTANLNIIKKMWYDGRLRTVIINIKHVLQAIYGAAEFFQMEKIDILKSLYHGI